jgi:hypothetical protein
MALDTARRVRALTTRTGFRVGHPHPSPPPQAGEGVQPSSLKYSITNSAIYEMAA